MDTQLPSDAGHLIAPPRGLIEGGVVAVDPGDPRPDLLDDPQRPGPVRGEHPAGQTVDGVVGQGHGLLLSSEGLDGDHRAENLLPDNGHLRGAVVKDGGLHKVSLGALALGVPRTAADQGCPLFHPLADKAQNVVHLALADHGPHVGVVQGIAQGNGVGPFHQAPQEGLLKALLNEDPGPGGADLPLVEENPDHGPLHGPFQVGVGKDDVGGFSPQLQADLLDICRRAAHNVLSHRRGPGEGHHADTGMGGDGAAHRAARPQDQVDRALGHAGLFKNLKHLHRG